MNVGGKLVKGAIVILFSFSTTFVSAQNNRVGTWNLVNAEYYFKNKYFIWGELQTRAQKVYQNFFYHELKGGFGYKPNPNITLAFGMGQYGTYSINGNFKTPMANHEFRIWEQLNLNNYIGTVKIENRYRIEQRWRGGEYRNRFRYRFFPMIPINKRSIEKGALFVAVYDEIFLTDTGPHFERNRVFGGLGYQVSSSMLGHFGWLNQFDFSPANTSTNKNFVHLAIYLQLNKK